MRLRDWDVRLFAAIEARSGEPFVYGVHDCATFSAYLVQAMTGVDVASRFASTYDSAASAKRKYRDVKAAVTKVLGVEPIDTLLAQRGDVVLLQGNILAVCVGAEAVTVGVEGVEYAPMTLALAAWRVGED